MKRTLIAPATVVLALGALSVAGCDTSRVNKVHTKIENVSDVTTTGTPQPGFQAEAQGQPPVPGSPTGAGKDGHQPMNDSEARPSPGSEEGAPMAVTRHKKDGFERQ